MVQFSCLYMTTWKTIALTVQTFVGKLMPLLFNTLSRFIIAFLPRSKHLFISWPQLPSTVTLEPKKKKPTTASNFFPIYSPWSDGTVHHDLNSFFLMLIFKPALFTLLVHPHQEALLFLFNLLRLELLSSGYLRLLIFLLEILIPVCDSSSLAFHMMCSAYNLNKQCGNIQPCCTTFPILNQSVSCFISSYPCCFLTCIQVSQEGGMVIWYLHLFKHFPQFAVIHTVKDFSTVNEAKVYAFLELPWFLCDPKNVRNLISGSFASLKPSLYIWKVSIHVLLKLSLKDFQHNLVSMWNEHNFPVVWTLFVIDLLWDWNENWPFPVQWPLLSFPNLLTYWMQHFNSIIF